MLIYRLAKFIIFGCFGLGFVLLGLEVYEAHSLANKPAFTIYDNPAHHFSFVLQYLEKSKREGGNYQFKEIEDDDLLTLGQEELYAYQHKGAPFLIRNNSHNLEVLVYSGSVLLENNERESVLQIVKEGMNEPVFFSEIRSNHWLSFLFETGDKQILIDEVVDSYIPNDKWVSKKNPLINLDSQDEEGNEIGTGAKISLVRLNLDQDDYRSYIDGLTETGFRQFEKEQMYETVQFNARTKLIIHFDGRRGLIDVSPRSFPDKDKLAYTIVNCQKPNMWRILEDEAGNQYYNLQVVDPDVTLISGKYATTIGQMFEEYDNSIHAGG